MKILSLAVFIILFVIFLFVCLIVYMTSASNLLHSFQVGSKHFFLSRNFIRFLVCFFFLSAIIAELLGHRLRR